jgi:hypothetical protein
VSKVGRREDRKQNTVGSMKSEDRRKRSEPQNLSKSRKTVQVVTIAENKEGGDHSA